MTDLLRSAAEAALEALERSRAYVYETDRPQTDAAMDALRAVLAEPESDPCHVFSVTVGGGLCEWEPTTFAFAMRDGKHALYTAPPRREWVGLTDEEIADAIRPLCGENESVLRQLIDFSMDEYRAIEVALKEKNHD